MHEPFSLLVSVYDGDRPGYIRRALRSAVDEQTVHPDEVVIVRDGPVRRELAACLDELRANSPVPVTFVPLPHNGGLGPALDHGLAASWFDVIARMDADDVAMPHRFEVELPLIQNADIVGAGLLEFVDDTDHIVGQRVPPTDPGQIQRYARMLGNDVRAVNVAEPLVFYRVGATAFKRRGGTQLLRSELRLQREFRQLGFTSPAEYVRNVLVRGGYRLIPWWCRRAVYRPIVAHYSERLEHELATAAGPEPTEWEYAEDWDDADLFAAVPWREATLPVGA